MRFLPTASLPAAACGHYPEWLEYGYLEQGRARDAKKLLAACYERAKAAAARVATADATPRPSDKGLLFSFVNMRLRYLFDTEDWTDESLKWTLVSDSERQFEVADAFIKGYAAVKSGRRSEAESELKRFKEARAGLDAELAMLPDDNPMKSRARAWASICDLELTALAQMAAGGVATPIAQLRQAATIEEQLPYKFGPPFIDKPTYEALGEALLAANQPADARAAFEKALARTPGRTTALVGLMRAAEKSGDTKKAAAIKTELRTIWHHADRLPTEFQ